MEIIGLKFRGRKNLRMGIRGKENMERPMMTIIITLQLSAPRAVLFIIAKAWQVITFFSPAVSCSCLALSYPTYFSLCKSTFIFPSSIYAKTCKLYVRSISYGTLF
jgi:hypothetical protein